MGGVVGGVVGRRRVGLAAALACLGPALAPAGTTPPSGTVTIGTGGATTTKTVDGGATWECQTSGTTERLTRVSFVDPSTGWAVGYTSTILHTTDGGATWVGQAAMVAADLHDVFVLSATEAWAVGEQGGAGIYLRRVELEPA